MRRLLCLACALASLVHAELREWTGTDGSTLRAEFMSRRLDEVQLKTEAGVIRRVSFSHLSAADQEYIQLARPPSLALAVDPNHNFVDHSVTRRGWKDGYELLDFEIELIKKSRESYTLPLTLELYVIAENEINRDYVLSARTTRRVYFSGNQNKRVIKADQIALKQTAARTNEEVTYVGYVVVLRDKAGTALAVDSNKPAFAKNAPNLAGSRTGAKLSRDTLMPRR